MTGGHSELKICCLAIGLSILIHAIVLMGCFVLWSPLNLAPGAYVEVELVAQPETKTPQPLIPFDAGAKPVRTSQGSDVAPAGRNTLPAGDAALGPSPAETPELVQKIQPPENAGMDGQGDDNSPGLALAPPRVREKPPFTQPSATAGVKGTVVLTAEILEDGSIGRLAVAQSSGSPLLDAAARDYVGRWRFEAAHMSPDGKPVRALTSVWIRYD